MERGAKEMVRVRRSTMVGPESETRRHRIWLPKLDLFQVRTHLPTMYFYRPAADPAFFSPEYLKRALAKALVPFYPFAGRLAPVAGSHGRLELDCNSAGVLFVEAESGLALDEFGDFSPSPEKRRLLVPAAESRDGYDEMPLVVLQVTFFKCGSVCLGAGVHHTLSDGVSSLHFINSWSDVARGLDIAVPPSLNRSLVCARSPPTVLFHHPEYSPNPPSDPLRPPKPPVAVSILDILPDQIAVLKSLCSAAKVRYTTFEVIGAHVWRCACHARNLPADAGTRTFATVDGRSRLRPPLPPGYVGNVIFPAVMTAVVGDIRGETLEAVAARFRRAITRLDDEYLRSAIDYLEVQEDVTKIGRWVGEFPATDFSLVSWTRLPLYDADFGWGRPVYIGPAMLMYAGLCYIMPAATKDGGVNLAISLEEHCMEEFKRLFYELDGEL